MSEFSITRDYPHPIDRVWRTLTDPALVPRWTTTGQGGRPEGFAPVVGTKFRFIAKPVGGWRGSLSELPRDVTRTSSASSDLRLAAAGGNPVLFSAEVSASSHRGFRWAPSAR